LENSIAAEILAFGFVPFPSIKNNSYINVKVSPFLTAKQLNEKFKLKRAQNNIPNKSTEKSKDQSIKTLEKSENKVLNKITDKPIAIKPAQIVINDDNKPKNKKLKVEENKTINANNNNSNAITPTTSSTTQTTTTTPPSSSGSNLDDVEIA